MSISTIFSEDSRENSIETRSISHHEDMLMEDRNWIDDLVCQLPSFSEKENSELSLLDNSFCRFVEMEKENSFRFVSENGSSIFSEKTR